MQAGVENGMEVFLKVLQDKANEHYNVKWPDEAGMKASSDNLVHNRPNRRLMKGFFAVVQGGWLPCADYNEANMKNTYYEVYTRNVEEAKIFAFCFFGDIIHAGVNFKEVGTIASGQRCLGCCI